MDQPGGVPRTGHRVVNAFLALLNDRDLQRLALALPLNTQPAWWLAVVVHQELGHRGLALPPL